MRKSEKVMKVKFWGVRGSIPTPSKDFLKYGGNTPCVEVRCGDTVLIFDAGTGLKDFGHSLVEEYGDNHHEVNLLISHTHWDHIQGFPFFSYIFMKNKTINIYGGHFNLDIKSLLSGQMKREYFPIIFDEIQADMQFFDLNENPMKINDIEIYHTYLIHPALSLGFRILYRDKIFVYATDNELVADSEMPDYNLKNIGNLIKDADILVAECQYTDDEYLDRIGWGHSSIQGVVEICKEFGVKALYTFHHDPNHPDSYVDKMLKIGKRLAGNSLKVIGAKEGMAVRI